MVVGSNYVAITQTSDMMPDLSKKFLDIQANYRVSILSKTCMSHDNNMKISETK